MLPRASLLSTNKLQDPLHKEVFCQAFKLACHLKYAQGKGMANESNHFVG